MNDLNIIDLTPENIGDYGVCGYKDAAKHKELQNKINWYSEYYPKGLRIKAAISEKGGYQGMIEYIPGEYAHRPVNASGYLFIHCVFVGFKSDFKGKGFATSMIEQCLEEAKAQDMLGVAIVTRKGSFMVDHDIFLKHGFEIVDKAKPDFELLVYKFNEESPSPTFKHDVLIKTDQYKKGLTIIRSVQCPYTEKNVNAMLETAEKKFHLQTQLIDIKDYETAQQTPSPFGTFCIILDGEVISHHPISNTRFENILKAK